MGRKNDSSWANKKMGALTIFPAMRDGLSAGIYYDPGKKQLFFNVGYSGDSGYKIFA